MRPSSFIRRRAARWVRQSTRLWICIRSITSVRNRLAERRIWATPLSRPVVHTLVARNARGRAARSATRSPLTPSARPYIGELSIILALEAKSRRTTSRNGRRAFSSAPTSNTGQVPRPMTGIASPVDGIGRDSIGVSGIGVSGIGVLSSDPALPNCCRIRAGSALFIDQFRTRIRRQRWVAHNHGVNATRWHRKRERRGHARLSKEEAAEYKPGASRKLEGQAAAVHRPKEPRKPVLAAAVAWSTRGHRRRPRPLRPQRRPPHRARNRSVLLPDTQSLRQWRLLRRRPRLYSLRDLECRLQAR